ncbi:Connector enhancer of kinase suppressor of ras 1 [Camelus dromedarius]|uniref:Connector enhancer of kinase suppressor of ras 1 n=1 Tax=Camelus dromedarius TaxID=9838 RepID=A0A5N4CHK4_CAMDR|nr:Connector enhancer of kinase suppressor of ras 1 [Camelus dromedarius]
MDCPTAEKESKVLRICSHVAGTCHSVPSCSREELREQKAGWSACRWTILWAWRSTLPATACTSCLEGVPGSQVPNDSRQQILPGDNTVQVNEQAVLGWPQKNVVRELLREPEGGAEGLQGPRWHRRWCGLKGHMLDRYRQPQDEKAEGLINISSYSLESGQDQKKKCVFQLTHGGYKPFIFAADTLMDLSRWLRHLITCISKHQPPGWSPCPERKAATARPKQKALTMRLDPSLPPPPHRDASPTATPAQSSSEGALEGRSTPEAEPQERQALEEAPGDPPLPGEKLRRWKEQNQELCSEGLGAWGPGEGGELRAAPKS